MKDFLSSVWSRLFRGDRQTKSGSQVLELHRQIQEQVDKGNYVGVATYSPTAGLWLYRACHHDNRDVRSWVGSSDSGISIVNAQRVQRDITWIIDLMAHDKVFRRAVIALPDSLDQLRRALNLPDRQMWHMCMLAFLYERANQRKKPSDKVSLFVGDTFERYSKLEEHLDDIQSYLCAWGKEFFKDFPPK